MKRLSMLVVLALLILPIVTLASLYLNNPSLNKEPASYGSLHPDYYSIVVSGDIPISGWHRLAF